MALLYTQYLTLHNGNPYGNTKCTPAIWSISLDNKPRRKLQNLVDVRQIQWSSHFLMQLLVRWPVRDLQIEWHYYENSRKHSVELRLNILTAIGDLPCNNLAQPWQFGNFESSPKVPERFEPWLVAKIRINRNWTNKSRTWSPGIDCSRDNVIITRPLFLTWINLILAWPYSVLPLISTCRWGLKSRDCVCHVCQRVYHNKPRCVITLLYPPPLTQCNPSYHPAQPRSALVDGWLPNPLAFLTATVLVHGKGQHLEIATRRGYTGQQQLISWFTILRRIRSQCVHCNYFDAEPLPASCCTSNLVITHTHTKYDPH